MQQGDGGNAIQIYSIHIKTKHKTKQSGRMVSEAKAKAPPTIEEKVPFSAVL